MKLSTFCVLLASALMLMGAVIGGMLKSDKEIPEETEMLAAMGEASEEGEWLIGVSGRVIQGFGAEYSEELGQWSQNDRMAVEMAADAGMVEAWSELSVVSIDLTEGGSCILMTSGDKEIRIWPVNGVCVFEGSLLRRGDPIAESAENLYITSVRGGRTTDPAVLVRMDGEAQDK